MLKKIRYYLRILPSIQKRLAEIEESLTYLKQSVGRVENRQTSKHTSTSLKNSEFKVYSQWGEDGIIQALLQSVQIEKKTFIEFGVQDYRESNTRFLLVNNNWSGLVIDGGEHYINFIKKDPIYWRYNIKAVKAFINVGNINDLILKNGMEGEIGILSVDIDGNDYWVWEAIDVVSPAIVISEYNSRFGPEKAVTVPYSQDFVRSEVHYSMIYYGASLKALCLLAERKNYAFVGCNSAGNNAFFVRKDLKPSHLPELTAEEGYVAGQFRESRNKQGDLSFLSMKEEMEILESLPLVEVS
ncbi:MAG: hypothetical protein DCF25_08820 [Leptolyngbya foveolarum]|uniref:Uncharacterized protein n=1 Tax=Leptolyngbya foveolarum TaxID=47253 RepID=A0A2W4WA55_9CYAN|nr:MAG: hypothetical protein DCF25_08820 [Leptolyngbya foveolarum]